jgi:hypothetical protein
MLLTFPGTAGVDPKDAKNVENRHDSWKALEKWSTMSEHPVKLIEGFIDTKDNHWKDSIGIFQKL